MALRGAWGGRRRGAFAWVDGETRASLSVADRETGGLTEFYERGDDIGADGWGRLEEVVRTALPGTSWMTMSGNLPPGAPEDGYARLIALAHEAGRGRRSTPGSGRSPRASTRSPTS